MSFGWLPAAAEKIGEAALNAVSHHAKVHDHHSRNGQNLVLIVLSIYLLSSRCKVQGQALAVHWRSAVVVENQPEHCLSALVCKKHAAKPPSACEGLPTFFVIRCLVCMRVWTPVEPMAKKRETPRKWRVRKSPAM